MDWLDVRHFFNEVPQSGAELARLQREALADSLFRGTVISDDGRVAALIVRFDEMSDQEFVDRALDARIVAIVEQSAPPGVRVYVAGGPHVKAAVYATIISDELFLTPAAFVMLVVILGLGLGSWRGVVYPLGSVSIATLWTFGAMAYLGHPVTILTNMLAPLLLAIGSVYAVHVLARFQEERRAHPEPAEAALRCLEHQRTPVVLAGITTSIGFSALLITRVPTVFDLAMFSVLGVVSVTLVALTGLPAALALFPPPPPSVERRAGAWVQDRLDALLAGAARVVAARAGLVVAAWALLFAVAVAAIPRIHVDTDYFSYFDESSRLRRDFDDVNRLIAGAIPVYVLFRADEPGSFREPAVLGWVETVQREVAELPGVSHTRSVVDLLRVLNRAMSKDAPGEERLPATRAGIAELLMMVPKGDAEQLVNVDHSRANLIVRTGEVGSGNVRALAERIEGVIDSLETPAGVTADVIGNTVLLARSTDTIAKSPPKTVGVATAVIFLLVTLSLGSARLGAVAMVPNLVPIGIFFGLLGLGAAPLSLPTSLVGSIALGIAIDDTLHFLVRYQNERQRGLSPVEAAAICIRQVGRPIVVTSVMLAGVFLLMSFSGFSSIKDFGVLLAVTMGVCLATDLLLLPAILVRFRI